MTRGLATAENDLVVSSNLQLALFLEANFPSGYVRVHDGVGGITFQSNTYTGVGQFGGVEVVEEAAGAVATSLDFTLSGIDSTLLSYALAKGYRGRSVYLWTAFYDPSTGAIAGTGQKVWGGFIENIQVKDETGLGLIIMTSSNWLSRLKRPRNTYYTDQQQRALYAGDTGFGQVAIIQDKPLPWGSQNPEPTNKKIKP